MSLELTDIERDLLTSALPQGLDDSRTNPTSDAPTGPLLTNTDKLVLPPVHEPSIRDNVFYVDNTAIEQITTCPWKAYASLILRRKIAEPAPALIFGSHIHAALDYYYTEIAMGREPSLDYQLQLLESLFAKEGTGEDWRTLGMAQEVIRKYRLEYPIDPFDIEIRDGKPMVELPFAIHLGKIGKYTIIYMGKIDAKVNERSQGYTLDHKTSSMMGDGFWRDQEMTPQHRGYCYAYREVYGEEPAGYIINAIACRKPTKTGTSIEFHRRTFTTKYPESVLDQWKENCMSQIAGFLFHYDNGYFPRHFAMHCESKYGMCQFYRVCSMPPSQRMDVLMGPDYKVNEWSPLKGVN